MNVLCSLVLLFFFFFFFFSFLNLECYICMLVYIFSFILLCTPTNDLFQFSILPEMKLYSNTHTHTTSACKHIYVYTRTNLKQAIRNIMINKIEMKPKFTVEKWYCWLVKITVHRPKKDPNRQREKNRWWRNRILTI